MTNGLFVKCVKDIYPNHILEPLCTFASPRPYKLKLNSGIREILQLQDYTAELHLSEISSECRVNDHRSFAFLLYWYLLHNLVYITYFSSQTAEYTMSRIWANNGTVREALGIHKV